MRPYGVNIDLLKAFGYIERVIESEFFSEKTYFTSYVHNMFWATILYKYQSTNIKTSHFYLDTYFESQNSFKLENCWIIHKI